MSNQRKKIWIDQFQTKLFLRIAFHFILYQVGVWALVAIVGTLYRLTGRVLGPESAASSFVLLTAILAICLLGPALIVPLRDLRPVLFEPELASLVANVKTVCGQIPDAAVVYIPEPGLFADRIAPPLRALCGVRVAVGDVTPADFPPVAG